MSGRMLSSTARQYLNHRTTLTFFILTISQPLHPVHWLLQFQLFALPLSARQNGLLSWPFLTPHPSGFWSLVGSACACRETRLPGVVAVWLQSREDELVLIRAKRLPSTRLLHDVLVKSDRNMWFDCKALV